MNAVAQQFGYESGFERTPLAIAWCNAAIRTLRQLRTLPLDARMQLASWLVPEHEEREQSLRCAIKILRAYIATSEGDGPLRLTEALALADEALVLTTPGVSEGIEAAAREFERWRAALHATEEENPNG